MYDIKKLYVDAVATGFSIQRGPVSNPTFGDCYYDRVSGSLMYWDGTTWQQVTYPTFMVDNREEFNREALKMFEEM